MEKNNIEYLVDDVPRDLSYLDKYTEEEIEAMYQKLFGDLED